MEHDCWERCKSMLLAQHKVISTKIAALNAEWDLLEQIKVPVETAAKAPNSAADGP